MQPRLPERGGRSALGAAVCASNGTGRQREGGCVDLDRGEREGEAAGGREREER